jgi:hypothetical protein
VLALIHSVLVTRSRARIEFVGGYVLEIRQREVEPTPALPPHTITTSGITVEETPVRPLAKCASNVIALPAARRSA